MLKLHPEVLKKKGKKEFVVLPYEEFVELEDLLADARDLLVLREAKRAEGKAPTTSLADLKRRLGL
ncbi:MAG: type II toxin-antitoxin system Phd/YefM family antitoxin [Planctomycetota bacterium]